jgi:hypothetical protein
MADTFAQEVDISLPNATDPWRIAADLLDLFEAGLANVWPRAFVEYSATSRSLIKFSATDLVSLEEKVTEYGGPMRDVSIYVSIHLEDRSLIWGAAYVWPRDDGPMRADVAWRTPTRIDTERFQVSCARMFTAYKRRRRWTDARWSFDPVNHRSEAEQRASPSPRPVLTLAKGRWAARRWFVRNRDNLIISLGGGLLISLIVIGLQIAGIVAVP